MEDSLVIWVLADGKPGHENQSLGLAEALGKLRPCEIHRVSLPAGGWLARCRRLRGLGAGLPAPGLVLGAGHATHPALLWVARRHRARSVVMMKPSLPLRWFDLCVAPEHDFPDGGAPAGVLTTCGALNRVAYDPAAARAGGLVLVGGPSATHGWDAAGLLEHLERVVATSAGPWWLTTSRRTPADMVAALRARLPGVTVCAAEETDRDWVPRRLAAAAEAWVTEDSVSMVYEALSSGVRVGVLPVPRVRADTRVLRGLARLEERGFVTGYESWLHTGGLAAPPHVLREADRVAAVLNTRFFAHACGEEA